MAVVFVTLEAWAGHIVASLQRDDGRLTFTFSFLMAGLKSLQSGNQWTEKHRQPPSSHLREDEGYSILTVESFLRVVCKQKKTCALFFLNFAPSQLFSWVCSIFKERTVWWMGEGGVKEVRKRENDSRKEGHAITNSLKELNKGHPHTHTQHLITAFPFAPSVVF